MTQGIAVGAGALTLLLSLALPFGLRGPLERWGVVDVPNERSSHVRPVLRGMGLAVLLAMVAGGGLAIVLFVLSPGGRAEWLSLMIVFGGSLAAGLLGWREDLGGLSVPARSAVTLVIALAVSAMLLWAVGGLRDGIPTPVKIGLVIYAVLFISSYINVANFMDGLNGMSGLHGLIAGATFTLAGIVTEIPWLTVSGVVLAAAFTGFLPWNLSKPGAFLGDVGSYLLGGAVAITSFAALVGGVPMLATIGPMVIYFGDVAVTLVKRVRVGKKWYEPHKEHAYQRIQQLGYSHVHASCMTAAFTLLVAALGLLQIWFDDAWPLLLALGLVILVVYLLMPRVLPRRS